VPYGHEPSFRNWDKANLRLAQLLEDIALLEALTEYYEKSHEMSNVVLGAYSYSGDTQAQVAFDQANELISLSDAVRPRLEEMGAQRRPWYVCWFGG
jgi:hypothetical protein